ncbi:MAG TPA: hypothetical protein PK573_08160 [Spirochaetota bacterium]|nr:hypothetical protein [Spirochaetota bacterium]
MREIILVLAALACFLCSVYLWGSVVFQKVIEGNRVNGHGDHAAVRKKHS